MEWLEDNITPKDFELSAQSRLVKQLWEAKDCLVILEFCAINGLVVAS
jgi:hypothetical protein